MRPLQPIIDMRNTAVQQVIGNGYHLRQAVYHGHSYRVSVIHRGRRIGLTVSAHAVAMKMGITVARLRQHEATFFAEQNKRTERKAGRRSQCFPDSLLRFATRLLPPAERSNWVEEQQGYLVDLSSRRARWGWVFRQVAAMPRYAYTVHTGRETESA